MKTGIYMIRNKINDKKYIGQAVDIDARWATHIRELNDNNHNNRYLQNSWNKYGADNFEFTILCQIYEYDKNKLNELEIYYIKKFESKIEQNGYNQADGGDGWSPEYAKMMCNRPEYLEKLRQATIEGMKKSGTFNAKKVYCVTTNTVYESIGEVSRKLGIDRSYISWCCNGKYITKRYPDGHHIRGLEFWFLDEWESLTEDKKLSCKKIKYGRNSVYCVTNNTIYAGTVEAGEKLGIDYSCIGWCCRGKNINKRYPDGHHHKKGKSKDSPVYEFWYLSEYEEKFGKAVM